ncbi:conserved protein, unknown function [Hepatocystis sp. ex Piliocolobus tephrosceles]|nr:conserved protein, unknown function [Hepatocystis sp. ex Piliocolobus tephrosceles]
MSLFLLFLYIFHLFHSLHYCFQKYNITKSNTRQINNYHNKKRVNNISYYIHKKFSFNKHVKKSQKYQLFYKSKKERDILESGYLYPFDHLEKKKKKFPPDPYVSTDDELKDTSYEIYDENVNNDDLLTDGDDDAKKYFGECTFNRPYTMSLLDDSVSGVNEGEDKDTDTDADTDTDTDADIDVDTDTDMGEDTYTDMDEDTYTDMDEDTYTDIYADTDIDTSADTGVDGYANTDIGNGHKNKTSEDINSEMYSGNDALDYNKNSYIKHINKNKLDSDIVNDIVNKSDKTEKRSRINVIVYGPDKKKAECEIVKDQLYYLLHSIMDNIFIKQYKLCVKSSNTVYSKEDSNTIYVSYEFEKDIYYYKTSINCLHDLILFTEKLKKVIEKKINILFKDEEENENIQYINKNLKKKFEMNKKERTITNLSKKNIQVSIESSLKLVEQCLKKIYTQKFEITLHDLKLAYNMLPCKYYGYFLSKICAHISMLSYYINDLQGTFHFALKSIKYEPQYCLAWKCLGDAYRSSRKFWQAKNFYDIAMYLGYKDKTGESFNEITHQLANLTENALKNVSLLKQNMNSHVNIIVKKNIGIVLNKNPDSIGGCYVSYIIEGGKASKKNFNHGDQIIALNNIVTYGQPIDFCLKSFQKNNGVYDIIFFKGNIIELYGLKAYKYLIENGLFYTLFENEKIASFKKNENILFDMKGFGIFSEYGTTKGEI